MEMDEVMLQPVTLNAIVKRVLILADGKQKEHWTDYYRNNCQSVIPFV